MAAAVAVRAADAVRAAEAAAEEEEADAWYILNPIGLLRQLIEVTHKIAEPPVLAELANAARAVGDMPEGCA